MVRSGRGPFKRDPRGRAARAMHIFSRKFTKSRRIHRADAMRQFRSNQLDSTKKNRTLYRWQPTVAAANAAARSRITKLQSKQVTVFLATRQSRTLRILAFVK